MEKQKSPYTSQQNEDSSLSIAELSSGNDLFSAGAIVFEQALNENMRLALRLEHLFTQFNSTMQNLDQSGGSRLAMRILLRILDVAKRPDMKSKIIQSLSLQSNRILTKSSAILDKDQAISNSKVIQINDAVDKLHSILGRVGEELYENEFLNTLHLQLNGLGGGSDDRMPAFKLWLNKPTEQLREDLLYWFSFCHPLPEIIELLLSVTRQGQNSTLISCEQGFYAQNLINGVQNQILQIKIPKSLMAYPEVSVGKHRLSIRFVKPEVLNNGKNNQITEPFDFKMTICSS